MPFEGFEGQTQKDVVQLMERIKDYDHALQVLITWNKGYEGWNTLKTDPVEAKKELYKWYHNK